MLGIARACTSLTIRPKRSILFIATTAEEQGLLGAEYYSRHPLVPIKDTIADINLDSMNILGFFFSSRRRHTRCSRDWSSDVCSSDLRRIVLVGIGIGAMLVAVNSYLISRARLDAAQAAAVWLVGTLNGRGWEYVRLLGLADRKSVV